MVGEDNSHYQYDKLYLGKSKYGDVGLDLFAIRCVNADCNEVFLRVDFSTAVVRNGSWAAGNEIASWTLRPMGSSKVQPEYIPAPLREDYQEACLIRDQSPKAAATLARRCLQGMIRDFCGISKPRLIDEIKELKKLLDEGHAPKGVEAETIEAIDAVRDIGNIGAHMEKDINLIVDVDPGEAQALIELIEMLFTDWYVARFKREQRLASVKAIAAEKKAAIEAGRVGNALQRAAAIPEEGP